MQIANAWLILDERGSNIPVKNVTPAEAVYLNTTRKRHKDDTEQKVIHIKVVGNAKRTNAVEKERLLRKYPIENPKSGKTLMDEIWPGPMPSFPQTFEEAAFEVTGDSPKEGKRLPYPILGDQEPLFARTEKDVELIED